MCVHMCACAGGCMAGFYTSVLKLHLLSFDNLTRLVVRGHAHDGHGFDGGAELGAIIQALHDHEAMRHVRVVSGIFQQELLCKNTHNTISSFTRCNLRAEVLINNHSFFHQPQKKNQKYN